MKKLILLPLFALFGLIAGTTAYYWMQWKQPSLNQESVVVKIEKGSSSFKVGLALHDAGILQSATSFKWYCKISRSCGDIKAGAFEIPAASSLKRIVDILTLGLEASRHITIPEGRASWEIFEILKPTFPDMDSTVWDSLVHSPEFAQELEVPANNLEGWLFPDTYPFPLDANEEAILRQMVRAMKHCISELDTGKTTQFQKLGGWNRVLTLASIVEEETGKVDERAHVASVFHNRLKLGMPLGADPTVRFIFRNLTGPIYKSQLASNSPYNTRKHPGLPPGPISNPGRKAIEAALKPLQTKDLYFVAKDDGSGKHFFAQTLVQHNQFKGTAAKNRGE